MKDKKERELTLTNKIGSYNKDAKLPYKVRDILTSCLNAVERFLNDIKTKFPDSLPIIIDNLKSFYNEQERFDVVFESEFELLNQYPEILNGSKNHVLSILNYTKYDSLSIDEEIEIFASDIIRVYTHFEYYLMRSLLEIMTREEAIEYMKKLNDEITLSRNNPENYVNSFEESINHFKTNLGRWQMQECVTGPLDQEILLYKVKRCEWADALKEFDSEFCFAMLCYSDFKGAQNLNPNFVLTREKTLMMGNNYCGFCFHDTRRSDDLTHPPESAFEDLN